MTEPTSGADVQAHGAPLRVYTCGWCGQVSDGTALSCPACGAAVDVHAIVTNSGWVELPGRRDMAKIQFGQSFCQVEGNYVPVADMELAAGESVYFSHHMLLWKDTRVELGAMPMKGAWKRMLAGMPLIMAQAKGPGHIAFSRDAPGELVALPLQPGQAIDVREHLFLVATHSVTYDWIQSGIWFRTSNGDDSETYYPLGTFLDRFMAPQAPGLLLLHAAGNVFVRRLDAGQSILVKPTAFLFKDVDVQMHLHIERPAGSIWGNRHVWLRLMGPGRVAVQSAFEPMEDDGNTITSHSGATERHW